MNGDTLRKLRKAANLTQEELGKKIGITGSAIRMIELGKRKGSTEVINKLAKFFNIPLETLATENINEINELVVSNILDQLIETGAITDPTNISPTVREIILFAAQTEIKLKLQNKNNSN